MGWREYQVSTPVENIENIENIENMKTEGHLFDKIDKFDNERSTDNPHNMSLSDFEKAGRTLKVWSEILKEYVFLTSSETDFNRCNLLDGVAYTAKELQAMLYMTPDELRAAHEVKKVFDKARVIEHRKDRSCQ